MLANDLSRFEEDARKLMGEAMNLSIRHFKGKEMPEPEGAVSHLLQPALVSFVGATKVLLFVFRYMLNRD